MVTGHILWGLRLVVAGVFALAAWGKVVDPAATRHAVQEFGVPPRWAPLVGWLLPAVELLVAVAVLPSASAVAACCVVLLLLLVFSAAIAVQLRQGRHPSCSCFGAASAAPISRWTLARNAGLAGLAASALWGAWTHSEIPAQLPVDHAVGLAAVAILVAVQIRQAATLRALRRELQEARASRPQAEALPVGAVAPEFDLPGTDGRRSTLGSLLEVGRPVLLVFLHPSCAPCRALADELRQWRERWSEPLTLVPIGSGDLSTNATWAREHGLGEMLVQSSSEVALRYRVRGTPSAVLIEPGGRIAAPVANGPREVRELLLNPRPTLPSKTTA